MNIPTPFNITITGICDPDTMSLDLKISASGPAPLAALALHEAAGWAFDQVEEKDKRLLRRIIDETETRVKDRPVEEETP